MSRTLRSAGALLAGVGFLALCQAAPVRAQGRSVGVPPTEGSDPPGRDKAQLVPSLRAHASLVEKLGAASDYLKSESWADAARVLQALLDVPDDVLVSVKRRGKDGKEVACWTGIHCEAARLLDTLPASGRTLYAAAHGPRASSLLNEARKKADVRLMGEVARRYPNTVAGAEALGLLGLYHLDRGCASLARLHFARLLERPDADQVTPATLFQAALALRRAGDSGLSEKAWNRLATRDQGGVRVGTKAMSLADLREELERSEVPGTPARAHGIQSVSRMKPRWKRATAYAVVTRALLEHAVQRQQARREPALPAFFPIGSGDSVIYRSHRGLHAVDVRTGRQSWEATFEGSIDRMLALSPYSSDFETWIETYLDVSPHVLFGNALLGTLTIDTARLYAVEDLAVPPYRSYMRPRGRMPGNSPPDLGPGLIDAAYSSRLRALDAATGKPVWDVGGSQPGPLSDSYFLGPPLPLDDRLYLLTEKNNELAVACLGAAGGSVIWKQALTFAPTRMLLDPGRRLQAACPVFGEGVLVCPTNAGVIIGVDVLGPGLAWAYPYRGEDLTQPEPSLDRRKRITRTRVTSEWQAPITIVDQGKVVFTAPDSRSVHCLSIRDGSPLWEVARAADDHYVAGVFGGKVLVVGNRVCRALDLVDGKQRWQVETGEPSGRGVACGSMFYLPLKETVRGRGPAIYALDVDKGTIVARVSVPPKEFPGNLLVLQGELFSQTATAVAVYSARKDVLNRIRRHGPSSVSPGVNSWEMTGRIP
jgi:outer membrane protein assembly factor BamB